MEVVEATPKNRPLPQKPATGAPATARHGSPSSRIPTAPSEPRQIKWQGSRDAFALGGGGGARAAKAAPRSKPRDRRPKAAPQPGSGRPVLKSRGSQLKNGGKQGPRARDDAMARALALAAALAQLRAADAAAAVSVEARPSPIYSG